MENQNILHPNLLHNDPNMAQGLPQAQVGGGQQPQPAVGNQAIDNLADLIDQVAIAQPLQPPAPQVVAPKLLDRPLAMIEEQIPLNMVHNEIKQEAQILDLLGHLTRLVTANHQNVADLNAPQRDQLQALLEGMSNLQQNVHNNQVLLQNAQLKARRYRNAIDMPQFLPRPVDFARLPQDVSGKNIKNNAPVFNPAVPGADFQVTWRRLKDYGDQNLFNEREYVVALGQLLEEQAYKDYVQLRDNGTSLRGILEHMEEIFVPKKSYYEDQAEIDNFRRLKGESIKKAMRRALMCVEKLRHSVPDNDWPVLLKKYLEDILFKIVSPSTQKYLRKLNEVYTESGLTYDLNTMIQKADMHEVTNDAAPKTDMPNSFAQNVSLTTEVYKTYSDIPVPMDISNNYPQRSFNASRTYDKPNTDADWYNRDRPRDLRYSPDDRNSSWDRQTDWNHKSNSRDSSQNRFNRIHDKDNRGRSNRNGYNSDGHNNSQNRSYSYPSHGMNRDHSSDRYRNSSKDRYRENYSRSRNRSNSRDRNGSGERSRDNSGSSRDRYRSRSDSNYPYSRSKSRDRRSQTPSNPFYKGEKSVNNTTAKAKAVNIVLKDKSYYSCNVCSSLHAEDRCPLAGNC